MTLLLCSRDRMSDLDKEGLSHELHPEEGGATGESSWCGRSAVEYYNLNDECYRWWYTAENPTREGFSYSDTLVYLLEVKRDCDDPPSRK